MFAASIGVFGKIQWNGKGFIGNIPTTTDVLGPFYRPGAPFRENIIPRDYTGTIMHVSGTIYKEDGKTPFSNCFIEIWQADANGKYDNISDDYNYRGALKTGSDGNYHFITSMPAAYATNSAGTNFRPAHIHMRIEGQDGDQDLITQVYFKGDKYIPTDDYSSSPSAVNRILEVTKNNKNEDVIRFDIVMSKEFLPDEAVFKKIIGVYSEGKESMIEFYKQGDLLYVKYNGQIEEALYYKGDNTFSNNADGKVVFDFAEGNTTKAIVYFFEKGNWNKQFEGTRVFRYQQ